MRDMTNSKQIRRVISPVSVADNTAQVGQIIDHRAFDAATYIILTGSIADADTTFTVLLEESDNSDMSAGNAVADIDMISQSSALPEVGAAFQFDDDNEVRKLGYSGQRRYTRLTITPVNNASAAVLAACCVLEKPSLQPVIQAAS